MAIVFGAGSLLEPVRILWVVPRFGTRMAELVGVQPRVRSPVKATAWRYVKNNPSLFSETGIAKDVQARVKQHSERRGATYTRTRLPVKLLYLQEGLTRSEALTREAQIKALPRSKKEEIIFNGHRM